MKPLPVLIAIALLGLGATACGSSSNATGSTSHHTVKRDRDDDGDNNDDDGKYLNYGHAASGTEKQALTTLVTGYYQAAATNDGAKACALLYPFIAESVVEDYGDTAALSGSTCAAVMSKLFERRHRLLVGESATLKMYAIRVNGDKALTVLSFATLPEVRLIQERRDGKTWLVMNLLDSIVE